MSTLRLSLLGQLEIRHGGYLLPAPPTLKSQSLLAYLVLNRKQPQLRERMANLFWGDRPERKARRSLTTALWHIRRCLPQSDTDWLLTDVSRVQFNPDADLWLDVDEFVMLISQTEISILQSAIDLYRGPLLAGFYHDWVLDERYRLENLYCEGLARLMTDLEEEKDYTTAIAIGLCLLDCDPLYEKAHLVVMRSLSLLGERNAALKQYSKCKEILDRELGVDPIVEIEELYQSILDGQYQIGAAAQSQSAEPLSVDGPPRHGRNPLGLITRGPLLGRESEMAFLHDQYRLAQGSQGGLTLIYGEAGIGKTRLVQEFADSRQWKGAGVLWGRCYEFERTLPYQPVVEVLQSVISGITPKGLPEFPKWVVEDLAYLVPELSEVAFANPEMESDSPKHQNRLFESIAYLLSRLSTGISLIIIFEDLHWATDSTLQLIHYLTRNLGEYPVMFVGTIRPESGEEQHAIRSIERRLNREGLANSLTLEGLSLEAVEALVVEMSGCGDSVRSLGKRLYQETEGNPFYLVELIKAMFEAKLIRTESGEWRGDFDHASKAELPLPFGVSDAVQGRVVRLPVEVQQALQLAAVLGREFDFEILKAAWNQDDDATLEVLDVLLRHRFIEEGSGVLGRDYAFHHHKIQEVIYAEIPSKHRQYLHAQTANAMEKIYESNKEAVAAELAFHFHQAKDLDETYPGKAVHNLLLAADQARLAYALQEAVEYYQDAVALQKVIGEYQQAARTLMKLGLTYHTKFDFAKARQVYDQGFSLWQQAGANEFESLPPAPHPLRLLWGEPYTLDPALCNDAASGPVIDKLFQGLVKSSPGLNIIPEFAERWEVFDAGRGYNFFLRNDICWSDGQPLTAYDFDYSWKRMLSPAFPRKNTSLMLIKGGKDFYEGRMTDEGKIGVKAHNDLTLEVKLEEPAGHFLYRLAEFNNFPVPKHIVQKHGSSWTDVNKFVSSGPFKLVSWKKGEFMRLTRNPLYSGLWKGNVEEVFLNFFKDETIQDFPTYLEQYLRNELDILMLFESNVRELDRIRQQYADEYVSLPLFDISFLTFNIHREPLDNTYLRKAMAYAIDQNELANIVMRGLYTPGKGGLIPPGMAGHSSDLGFQYRPDLARMLLKEAGYTDSSEVQKIEALALRLYDPAITDYLKRKWEDVLGIRVSWERTNREGLIDRHYNNRPHLVLNGWLCDSPDPSDLALEATSFRLLYDSLEYEKIIQKARRTFDQGTRLGILQEADRHLVEEAKVVPLYYGRHHLLVKPWVRSFPLSPLFQFYWEDAIIDPH